MKDNQKKNNNKGKNGKNTKKKTIKITDIFGFGGEPSNLFGFGSNSSDRKSTISSNTSSVMSTEDLCRDVLQNEEHDAILFLYNELKKSQSKKSLSIHLPSTWSKSRCIEFGKSLKEIGIAVSKTSFLNVKTDYTIDYDLISPLKRVVDELMENENILSPNKESKITKRDNNLKNNKSLSLSLSINNNNNNNNNEKYNDDSYIKETMPPPSNKSSSIKRKSNNDYYESNKKVKTNKSMSFYDILSIFINKSIIIKDNSIISDLEEIRNYLNKKTINELKEFIVNNCNNKNIKGRKLSLIDNIINNLIDSLPINMNNNNDSILSNNDDIMKENIPESNTINNNNNNNSNINSIFKRPSISLSELSSSFDKKLENEASVDDSSDDSLLKSLNNSINNNNNLEEEKESILLSNNISNIIINRNNNEKIELLRKDLPSRPSYMNYSPNLNNNEEENRIEINNDENDKVENDDSSFESSENNNNNHNITSNSLTSTDSYSPENDKDLSFLRSSINNNSNLIRNNSLINSKTKIFERKRMSILSSSLSPKYSLPNNNNKSYEAVKTLSRISMFISKESYINKKLSLENINNLSVVLSENDASSFSSFNENSEIIKDSPNKEEEDGENVKIEEEEIIQEEEVLKEEKSFPISPNILTNILNYLPFNDIINNTLYVNKQWNRISEKTLSWLAGTNIINKLTDSPYILSNYKELWKLYPWGRYLSYGGFKEVYKIYNKIHNRYEALSIMDINNIIELNNEIVIEQEILSGFAVSEMVSMKDCEHFVEIYQVFQFKYNAPIHLWGNNENKTPQGNTFNINNKNKNKIKAKKNIKAEEGLYQYTRMEYCDIGDLEEYIKTVPDERMTLEDTIISMFQMTVSLYKAKKMCNLRHYDVKLLNFFGKSYKCEDENKIGVHWIYNKDENNHFEWKKNDVNIILKLADYGTSQMDEESLNSPITVGNYTTIENLPIEYFVNGNECIQDYSCDIWGLGLSFLHLLTGSSPYEEILSSVKCPKLLLKKLKEIINKNKKYSVLKSVMDGDEDEICLTTLYRIIVLFDLPKEDKNNELIRVILETMKNKKIKEDYLNNRKEYSLEFGENYYISRCRERLKEIENGYEILLKMFEYDYKNRININELIESSLFNSLKSKLKIDENYEIKNYFL